MPSGLRLVRDEPGRIVLAHEQPFQIAEAQFRPATREVIFAGETSIIEPRVMQLLVALHRAGGAVVSKDDLASLCWEGRVVGEDAINRVVSRARSVADKQAPGQFRIETITKVGYRLIGAEKTPAGERHGETATGRGLPRREMMIGAAGLTAVALAGLGWRVLNRQSTPPEAQALLDATRGWLCGTVDQTGNSVAQVRRAVQLAPNSAEAWGLLAFAYMRYAHAAPPSQRSDLASRGKVAMRRAFALEPNQPDALAAQLWTIPNYRNWVNFEAAARAALRLHPENTILGFALGMTLGQVGRLQEALPYIERTLAAYPMVPGNHVNFAMGLWDLGRLDDADSAISKGFDLFPHNTGIWFTRLYFLLYNDRAAEAAAMLSDIDRRPSGVPEWDYDLARLQVDAIASGDRGRTRRTIAAWDKAAGRGTGFTENGAIFAAFIGDLDECFRLFNALYFNRGIRMADTYFSKAEGIYPGGDRSTYGLFRRPDAAMRRDPRFAILTRQLGLDDYWRRTKSRAFVVA